VIGAGPFEMISLHQIDFESPQHFESGFVFHALGNRNLVQPFGDRNDRLHE
jgi:hypothetical protein